MLLVPQQAAIILFNVFVITTATDVLIRLAASASPEMGRLEVKINGTWGTVYSSNWGEREAHVVCRQLGYIVPVTRNPLLGHFGKGIGMPVHMAGVKCHGNESNILDCLYKRPMEDSHGEDVGVICKPNEASDYHVRLSDGDLDNSGRVEIYLRGTWGSICDTNWNLNGATVVCRNLGFAAADAYHPAGDVGESSEIHLHDVLCQGTESGLRYCGHQVYNETTPSACTGGRSVGVTCLQRKDFQTRLMGSNQPNEGRIEVLLEGVWSPVLSRNWELRESSVACRALGYETAYDAVTDGRFGDGQSGLVYGMVDVECKGKETSLHACTYNLEQLSTIGSDKYKVGVVCGSINAIDGDVRLVDGKNLNEGRLEIHHFGKWGSICMDEDGWSVEDVTVACVQLGYPSGNSTIESIPGPKDQPIYLNDVICSGNEKSLSDCQHGDWGIHDCSHKQDVALACNRNKDFDVRLVGGEVASEGIVEVFINYVWDAMCYKDLLINDAYVVCRSLGFNASETVYLSPTHVPETFHRITLNCVESDKTIEECSPTEGVNQLCHKPASISCSAYSEDGQFRLLGDKQHEGVPGSFEILSSKTELICDDDITIFDKNVICRSMGYASAKTNYNLPKSISTKKFDSGYGCFVKNIACKGTERDVRDCPKLSDEMSTSYDLKAMYTFCNDFTEHSVRLISPASSLEGRFEIYHEGQWGTVCRSPSWSYNEDAVVCRSLGLGPPSHNSSAGLKHLRGRGPIHLSDVSCIGSESTLAECKHSDWGINKCVHTDDIMIECSASPPNACGHSLCKDDETCQLGPSLNLFCQSEDGGGIHLVFLFPILVFFLIVAVYITIRLCHSLPVQPHKDCVRYFRRCCRKKGSNYRIVLTGDEVILVENES
ncbi:scavenger receptor cysteine-rich domain superfamily protein-like isoform X2 [Antedon mediterranea]|uniref:scavenger receptor cysteine-rich domain superfamily protein-like isoform X2 n=1 Tax=Antedon mediterranea TaxID=105859 RepID=UPI003AF6085C